MSKRLKRSRTVGVCARRSMRGVALIEALVAVLLSAIGLLALAGANVASIRYSKISQYRGTATMLAADLAERMRANPEGMNGYAYAVKFETQAAATIGWDQTCEGYTKTCTDATTQMAASDLKQWRRVVRDQLPDGSVSVAVTAAGADVWLAWRDPAVAKPDENNTEARLTTGKECPPNFSTDQAVRCIYFRINL